MFGSVMMLACGIIALVGGIALIYHGMALIGALFMLGFAALGHLCYKKLVDDDTKKALQEEERWNTYDMLEYEKSTCKCPHCGAYAAHRLKIQRVLFPALTWRFVNRFTYQCEKCGRRW